MKKVFSVFSVFAILFMSSNQLEASCDGNFYNITNWDNVVAEFTYHCCAGDVITVRNVITGEIRNLQMPATISGDGSSCA